jgi:predicted nucleic-acid-binding protein
MKHIFVDANVLLEILFDRKLSAKCQSLIQGRDNQYSISTLTVHIVWYMAEKYKLQTEAVDSLLSVWSILPIAERTASIARIRYDGKDFEDCLQAVSAEEAVCDEIITIDIHFKEHSHTELPVLVIK